MKTWYVVEIVSIREVKQKKKISMNERSNMILYSAQARHSLVLQQKSKSAHLSVTQCLLRVLTGQNKSCQLYLLTSLYVPVLVL